MRSAVAHRDTLRPWRDLRLKMGWTVKQAADFLGVGLRTFARWDAEGIGNRHAWVALTQKAGVALDWSPDPPAPVVPALRLLRGPRLVPDDEVAAMPEAQQHKLRALPLYSLRAACGGLGTPETTIEPDAWLRVDNLPRVEGQYVVRARGHSMEPLIPDGALVLFTPPRLHMPEGVVLAQWIDGADPDTGASYGIKRLRQADDGVELVAENEAYDLIHVPLRDLEQLRVVGEFVAVLAEG